MQRVSIIIPAYNEEAGIQPTLQELREALAGDSTEIIVVDDGSTDKTAQLAQGLADRVVSHATNRGKGAAMRTGFEVSNGECIVFLDADGTYPAMFIPSIVRKLEEVDVVFTCRTNREHIPLLNRFGNWLITGLIKRFSGFIGNDPLSGLYGLRREALKAIGLESSTFAIETEIVVKVSGMRFSAAEIPIAYRSRLGLTKLRPFRDGWRILRVLVDLLFIFRPVLTFTLPGSIIALIGLCFAGVLTVKGAIHLDHVRLSLHTFLTSLTLILLGANTAFYGIIIDLYAVRHRFKKPSRVTRTLANTSVYTGTRNFSLFLVCLSVPILGYHFMCWQRGGYGPFVATRSWMLSLTGFLLGLQGVYTSIIGKVFAKDCLEADAIAGKVDALGSNDRQHALCEGKKTGTCR
ncbi:MAG: glycosyltransferase [Firmicutes bacterium]|nr:glycosyltransferase [Bacillota bacterium]